MEGLSEIGRLRTKGEGILREGFAAIRERVDEEAVGLVDTLEAYTVSSLIDFCATMTLYEELEARLKLLGELIDELPNG